MQLSKCLVSIIRQNKITPYNNLQRHVFNKEWKSNSKSVLLYRFPPTLGAAFCGLAALGALAAFVVAFGAAAAGFLLVVALAVRLTSLAALQKKKKSN